MKYARINRALKNGLMSVASTVPQQFLELITGMASIKQLERAFNLVTGVAPISNVSYFVPGGGTYRTLDDYFEYSLGLDESEYNFVSNY